jgi:hypothetical protein
MVMFFDKVRNNALRGDFSPRVRPIIVNCELWDFEDGLAQEGYTVLT